MPHSLFWYISKALSQHISLFRWSKKNFAGAFFMALLLLLVFYTGSEKLEVLVTPVQESTTTPILTNGNSTVFASGNLVIESPSLMQKIFLPNRRTDWDFLLLIGIIFISAVLYLIMHRIQKGGTHKANVSQLIRLLAFGMVVHALLYIYRNVVYAPSEIQALTKGAYTSLPTMCMANMIEIWIAILLLIVANAYQRAQDVEREQALTI